MTIPLLLIFVPFHLDWWIVCGLSILASAFIAAFEARDASKRCSCASRNAAEMLRVLSDIDWRSRQQPWGWMLLRGGLQIWERLNPRQLFAVGQWSKCLGGQFLTNEKRACTHTKRLQIRSIITALYCKCADFKVSIFVFNARNRGSGFHLILRFPVSREIGYLPGGQKAY